MGRANRSAQHSPNKVSAYPAEGVQRAQGKTAPENLRNHDLGSTLTGLTRRCSQPLHRVQTHFSMTNAHLLQANLALVRSMRIAVITAATLLMCFAAEIFAASQAG